MREYLIRMEKSQREEVVEEYPNLAANPVYLKVKKFSLNGDLSTATDRQNKKIIKKHLNQTSKKSLNPNYEIEKKEKFIIVPRENYKCKIFEGEVQVPPHLQG